MESMLFDLLQGSLSVAIAFVFFVNYFQDKKDDKEYKLKQLEHERELAIIMNKSTEVVSTNQELIKDTRQIHDNMDETIRRIEEKLENLVKSEAVQASKQLEIITAINSIREMISQLKKV